MATWKEIEDIRKNPERFRALARQLLTGSSPDLNDWERTFLFDTSERAQTVYSVRQGETLLRIRDGAERLAEVRGFSVALLLKRCHEARLDLSDDDEQWIVALIQADPKFIRRRHAGRLLRCAAQLELVESE